MLSLVEHAVGRKLRLRESDELAPDSEISAIFPERMATVVPPDAGILAVLSDRLREYATGNNNGSTVS